MELVQYLICVASRHEQAKENHEEEMKELWVRQKKKSRQKFVPTYDDESALLKGVIGSVRGKPSCLKKLSDPAIGALAYIVSAKVGDDTFTLGEEIVTKLVYDPESTVVYLKGIAELKERGWLRVIVRPGVAFTDQPPFCYLQASLELGETFHRAMGVSPDYSRSFASNDCYLDAVFSYLFAIIHDESDLYRVTDPDVDLVNLQPEGWYRRIVQRVEISTCPLPAATAQQKYYLSVLQLLALCGLLARRDGNLKFDFSDPSDVTGLFARGRICRKQVREHLFGEKSPLLEKKLVEGTRGEFGESIRLTQLGIKALLGKQSDLCSSQELKSRVRKNTLFDLEEPNIRKDSVMLPPKVMEAIQSIIFSESQQGQEIRRSWHSSLPTAWGSPTGSTVLLFGPPGTGKTLTAQMIASELRLPLLKIDASRVLSCWVGESEQNVRRVFDDYATLQRELGKSPVLLFNEADQLLGTRDAGTSSVDRMNNNLQNLFLEGLEKFTGIIVGTTNRRDLLDAAFSRRFIFKLELPAPDRNLRMELWRSHLPLERLAGDVDIGRLADLALSGGEIRLVVDRAVRLLAYRGITIIDSNTLIEIAKEEIASRMKRNGSTGRIGFGAV
ncbi:ATP-binding protein [Geomonas edaphica]|uniref:ATP-binding protein n=1 Tax=Geomonas edaphica TaxID=2570226 RepID=UPI0010A82D16|nr:ATP-binding protein [Geomonas edaphica]